MSSDTGLRSALTEAVRVKGAGLAVACAAALVAMAVQAAIPVVSPLLLAIVLGIVVAHSVQVPARLGPGIKMASKTLLRAGIVLLGLQLVLDDILGLGWKMLCVAATVVTVGMIGTFFIGRALRLSDSQSILVAGGFSICGAAAVAAVEAAIDGEDEEVASAVGLVVVFGTVMIFAAPIVLSVSGMSPEVQGLVAGASIHEVAQVVAVGGIIGGGALTSAVLVKLFRVLLLAPVVMVIVLLQRKAHASSTATQAPPLVPGFILGFLVAMSARSFLDLPSAVLDIGKFLQVLLLSMAMFALGCGVHVRMLRGAGARLVALGAASTVLVFLVAFGGVLLVSGPATGR